MLNATEPNPDRDLFGFKEAVLSSFGFLDAFGFKVVQQELTLVRYESATVFLNVYHGRASFEMGIEMGRLSDPTNSFSLNDVVAWAGVEETEGFGQHVIFQVSNREGVQEFVPKLANLVRTYGTLLLHDDANAYRTAHEVASRKAAENTKGFRLRPLRADADRAWHTKDYPAVVTLYSSMREDLTNVETARLTYAEKQLQGTVTPGSCP